jgi:hypothetical protein
MQLFVARVGRYLLKVIYMTASLAWTVAAARSSEWLAVFASTVLRDLINEFWKRHPIPKERA